MKISRWILAALAIVGAADTARATSAVTYVSGLGTDTGGCNSPAIACRNFYFALAKTAPRGEIRALDAAQYGALNIYKAVSIKGVPGAGITLNSATGRAIKISVAATDTVHISGLTLDGFGQAVNGVEVNTAGSVVIRDCEIRNFQNYGILIQPTGATNVVVENTLLSNNTFDGLRALPAGGSVNVIADHVTVTRNQNGLRFGGAVNAFVSRGTVVANATRGLLVESGAKLRLSSSTVGANPTGVEVQAGAVGESAGDNAIRGNTNDVVGTLTDVGTR